MDNNIYGLLWFYLLTIVIFFMTTSKIISSLNDFKFFLLPCDNENLSFVIDYIISFVKYRLL